MRRLTAYFTLVALLLLAQQGALSHQVGHLQGAQSHSQHRTDDKKSDSSRLCVFHILFGTVLGVIVAVSSAPKFAANAVERSSVSIAHAFPDFPIIPASRGPPVLR
jgi:hypothetical protein